MINNDNDDNDDAFYITVLGIIAIMLISFYSIHVSDYVQEAEQNVLAKCISNSIEIQDVKIECKIIKEELSNET